MLRQRFGIAVIAPNPIGPDAAKARWWSMIAFDTNYLVRHLVQDDPKQCRMVAEAIAAAAQEGQRVVILDVALCEATRVLESVYAATRSDLLTALHGMEREAAFEFENPDRVRAAIRRFESSRLDFSDCLILETSRELRLKLRTFDRKLQKELS